MRRVTGASTTPTQERFVAIVRERYSDFGPQLAREYLARDHGFTYSTETLRCWMADAGLWQPKRRRQPWLHSPRARRASRGELVQIDGSHHDWFGAARPQVLPDRLHR